MASLNKVIIAGYLAGNPEKKQLSGGTFVTSVNVATFEKRLDKTTGEWSKFSEHHPISFFGVHAENAARFLKKGQHVLIEGRLRTNEFKDRNGNRMTNTSIYANFFQFVESGHEVSDAPFREERAKAAPMQRRRYENGSLFDSCSDIPRDDISF